MTPKTKHSIAKAGSVLVLGQGKDKRGFITSLVARTIDLESRLVFAGPVRFTKKTQIHIEKTILPLIDTILDALGLEQSSIEISAENHSVASGLDTGIDISGFSADLAVFMAMLGAILGLEIPPDCAFTGHVASISGILSEVHSLDIKIKCARSHQQTKRLFCPRVSFDTLVVDQQHQNFQATVSGNGLEIVQVRHLGELISRVVTQEQVILSALAHGYFDRNGGMSGPDDVCHFLLNQLEQRFYRYIADNLWEGKPVAKILNRFADFYIERQTYPEGFGAKLFTALSSVPGFLRHQVLKNTLVTRDRAQKLQALAKDSDFEDAALLCDCLRGKHLQEEPVHDNSPTISGRRDVTGEFNLFIATLSQRSFAEKWGRDIDQARSSFPLLVGTINRCREFIDIVESFYIHLVSCVTRTTINPHQSLFLKQESLILLEETFNREGGFDQAFAIARDGTFNGLRGVLDRMTDQYKQKRYEIFVTDSFTRALKQRDFQQRLEFIQDAVLHLRSFLSPECQNWAPERFGHQIDLIITAYIQSIDRFSEITATF